MATLTVERSRPASWRDYLELTKPKVVMLMLITSLVGMFLATRAGVPWTVLVFGNLGIGLCAAGAAAVNHVVDRRIDALMARTQKRPLAEGRISAGSALAFALLLSASGLGGLGVLTHAVAAWLTVRWKPRYWTPWTLSASAESPSRRTASPCITKPVTALPTS